jgi:hypothetical protein
MLSVQAVETVTDEAEEAAPAAAIDDICGEHAKERAEPSGRERVEEVGTQRVTIRTRQQQRQQFGGYAGNQRESSLPTRRGRIRRRHRFGGIRIAIRIGIFRFFSSTHSDAGRWTDWPCTRKGGERGAASHQHRHQPYWRTGTLPLP